MSNADLLPSLLSKINQNQLALRPPFWSSRFESRKRRSCEVAENVQGALEAISRNMEFSNMTLAVLMTPE